MKTKSQNTARRQLEPWRNPHTRNADRRPVSEIEWARIKRRHRGSQPGKARL